MNDHNYITDDDFLRDVRNLISVLDPLPGASADHITAGGLSTNPQVAELLNRISDITRRDALQEGCSRLPEDGVPPEGASLNEAMPGRAPLQKVPLEQPVSPERAPLKVPPAGASSFQQRGQSHLDVTPVVKRAGAAAACSLLGRHISNRSISAYLTAITSDRALSELRGLALYITKALLNIAHEIHETESSVEYAYAATYVQSRSMGKKSEIIQNTFKQAITLSTKLEWKAASDMEVASLKRTNVYTILPATYVPTGHKIIGSRLMYKTKADCSVDPKPGD